MDIKIFVILLALQSLAFGHVPDETIKESISFKHKKLFGEEFEFSLPKDLIEHPKGILIVDYKDCIVTCYDKNWRPIFSFGKKGEGPGEFMRPINAYVNNDSIYIFDLGNYSLNQFDLSGKYITRTKKEKSIRSIRKGTNITCFNYYHKPNQRDIEIKDSKFKDIAAINIKNADAGTNYCFIAVSKNDLIYAAPINKYIIEVYDAQGKHKKTIRHDYEEPPRVEFPGMPNGFTLAAVNGIEVNEKYIFVLRGGHQDLYQQVSSTKHLDEKYNNRIDILDHNGKLVSFFWDPRLAVQFHGVYSPPIFKLSSSNSLFLQDPADTRLIHEYSISQP